MLSGGAGDRRSTRARGVPECRSGGVPAYGFRNSGGWERLCCSAERRGGNGLLRSLGEVGSFRRGCRKMVTARGPVLNRYPSEFRRGATCERCSTVSASTGSARAVSAEWAFAVWEFGSLRALRALRSECSPPELPSHGAGRGPWASPAAIASGYPSKRTRRPALALAWARGCRTIGVSRKASLAALVQG